ncbi:MAG TPA: TadE family protein [Terriglobales bacterium]|nr:TadE family protein [Terriglobales bacterium]
MTTRKPRMMRPVGPAGRSECGATLVEAALTLIVFFVFLFGILEFGRAYNVYQTLTNAAREGARFAVAPCPALSSMAECPYGQGVVPTQAAIQAQVQAFLDGAHVKDAVINVSQNVAGSINGAPTEFTNVSVTAPYSFLFFPFGTINLKTQAVMRNENN